MKFKKIDPALMRVVQDYDEEGAEGLVRHVRSLGLAHADAHSPKPASAVVFLHCSPSVDLSAYDQAGVVVNQPSGKIRTALVPLAAIDTLSENSKIKRIVASRRLRPLMDVAAKKVKLLAFRTAHELSGANVVVGIVDTGIDSTHADFAGRINRIWDQTVSGPGVAEGAYGVELTGTALTVSQDEDGHGTHVAGMAAGAGPKYQGVAPRATLVIVKTDFQDAHIADGIRYVFRVAGDLGMPAVVNLSLGGHSDAHDGSDSLSQTIEEQSAKGRIVCCAAGNEGNDNIHAQVKLGAVSQEIRFQVPRNSVGLAELNGWYPGTGRIEIAVRGSGPSGLVTPFQKVIATGNFSKTYTLGNARIRIQTPGPDPDNGDINFRVAIRNVATSSSVPSGIWRLLIRNTTGATGTLHIWSLDDQDAPQVFFTGDEATDSHKIGSPGCAKQAVTVAAFTTRNAWTDRTGAEQGVEMELNAICDFSSEGPLRDGTRKPDVAAPGAMIISCLSSHSQPEKEYRIDDTYLAEAGTSMACPFAVGLVALLLERKATLDAKAVKKLLKDNSAIPGKPAGAFDSKWGFGLINAKDL